MKLLIKIDLVLLLIMALGLAFAAHVAHSFLVENAQAQVMEQAQLMMASASAVRDYTADDLKPLLLQSAPFHHQFLPEVVPAFGAVTTFSRLRKQFPDYTYKEPALNPTNLEDRAADWESDIIEHFRNTPADRQFAGKRETPAGTSLFLARPIVAEQSCLECHSTPEAAPRTMIAKYGPRNGFGWRLGETVGAQVVSVPMQLPVSIAARTFRTWMWSLATIFGAILLAMNAALYVMVILPVRRLARVADRVSLGQLDSGEIKVRGSDEIAELAAALNRLFVSVRKALRLLEP